MAKPTSFAFSIDEGDPVRLATAIRDIVSALQPLPDNECREVIRAIGDMYAAPDLSAKLLDALEGIVINHDSGGVVDGSWWEAGRAAIIAAGGKTGHGEARRVRR